MPSNWPDENRSNRTLVSISGWIRVSGTGRPDWLDGL